jgi:hypothetical protein
VADETDLQELRNEIKDLKKYVGRSLSAQSDATDQKISQSARRQTEAHDQTKRDLATAKQKTEKLGNDLDKTSRRTDDRLDALARRLDKLDARLDTLALEAEATQREVELVHRKIRRIEVPGSAAEIDTWAAGQAELATQVAEGREAARKLGGMADVRTLRARIDAHDTNVAGHRAHQDQAIAAARQLAELDPAAAETTWTQHMRAWSRHEQAAAELAGKLAASQADATAAQAELAGYSQRTSELVPTIDQGEIADGRLRERVRGYLETVVAADQFLPSWLEVALGPGIPRKHWREWMDTALGIIRYRLVYRVTSLVDALGERPDAEGERQAEYDRLTEACLLHWR